MPETTMWGLVVSFLLLAIAATLKSAEAAHSLKLANEEITRLRKQIEAIQNETKNLPDKASEPNAVNVVESLKLPSNSVDTLHNIS